MMKNDFKFADLHCHPTLKTYGHSFENSSYGLKRRNIWYQQENSFFRKKLSRYLGLTKFSQADFTTLRKGNVKIVTVSLYPFEKGFFVNLLGSGSISAFLANIITGISYYRIRNIQQHTDYFEDLEKEYEFLLQSITPNNEGELFFPQKRDDFKLIHYENKTAILLSIEGAHVFNSGLKNYGKETVEKDVLENVYKVKKWKIAPKTITFAHNFGNDFCGHARSLDALGPLVNQNEMINDGFTNLGIKVLKALLDDQNGKIIYPDLKHMSLQSRREYYQYLQDNHKNNNIPIIVSHGAITGISWNNVESFQQNSIFCATDINFYDEELIAISKSNGLFAIQLDGRRLAKKSILNALNSKKNKAIAAAEIVWKHLEHIAILLDKNDLYAWNCTCIGSDFDGTINPLPGIYSASDLPQLAANLVELSAFFLSSYSFKNDFNKMTTADTIVSQFCYHNLYHFYSDKF